MGEVTRLSFRLQAGHMPSWQGFRLCLVFLPHTATVVYTPVWAISRPEFTAAAKAW